MTSEHSTTSTDHPPVVGRGRRPGLVLGVAVGFVAGALVAGAGAAWAGHQFSDVPDTNPFHDDIAWMANHGIAEGDPDGTYRPTNPVSRQAMAAFLHRLVGEVSYETTTFDPGTAIGWGTTITCRSGKRAIAGAGEASSNAVVLVESFPSGSPDNPTGWNVTWRSASGAAIDPTSFTAYVTCMPMG